ncbi:MAG: cyclic nucleotide-binding domain-containing protein [Anaerolineae bacterium]|nr:cyclic nucleotide-binding domain-containing protein [Anaerolineae bacterium]MDK1080331.1 cyclic nucleotide-binding domain-containing protein [Anaerolineae bacterium]MDK1117800.1 cyclic nucleotide-binding domain-containing protein [Anaerolineae bacterium]
MDQETISQLKNIDWFDELSDDMLAGLAQKILKRTLKKDEVLFQKGDEGNSLFIINSGWVKVIARDTQGSDIVLNQVGAGEIIGEMALLDNEPRSAGVVALEKTEVLELKRVDFMEILKQQPDLALSVIRNFSSRMRYNTSYIEKITEMSKRVAKGDYSFIGETQASQKGIKQVSDQDKIGQLLAEFFAMVQGVKSREDDLKNQVEKLTLQIDESQLKEELDEITGTDFYVKLKDQAKKLREQRLDNK